jgi:hypothetical protein
MTLPVRDHLRGKPRLTLVHGTRRDVARDPASDWRRLAQAVTACTQELAQHLVEHRWGRVDEAIQERRELLAGIARLPLDGEGRSCLRALTQATEESEAAIVLMIRGATMGARRQPQ